ncbi:hypothetical protein [Candidatus Palauibacter sp.]|uniref:hypothetical protein n=1 Tax=Candidatus Palauibacter sp. TaxID=3101350 RepID=UPI003B52B4F3
MRRFVVRGMGLVLPLLASIPGVAAQEETVIPDDPTPPCTIEFIPAGPELSGGVAGVLADAWPSLVAEIELLPDGRITMAESFSDRFFVASPDGSGGRWVGRAGEGPGEYSFVRWAKPAGERLHVFDPMLMRRTVLDAATLDVVRTNRLEPIHFRGDAVVLDDSSYVINGAMYTEERAGYVLHLFDGAGEVVRSFDEIPIVMPGEEPIRGGWRILEPARAGGAWSAWRSEYRIDLWNPASGVLRRSLVRNAPWFLPHNDWGGEWHPERPDNPVIADIMEDSEDRLWVVVLVASDRWSECWVREPPSAHPEAPEYTPRAGCPRFERRIEVLDPEAGRVLAAKTLPLNFGLLRLAAGKAFSVVEEEFGPATVRQWRPALRPANNSQGRSLAC